MVLKGADKMAKNGQKCWSQPGFEPGAFQRPKKGENFLSKALPLSYTVKIISERLRLSPWSLGFNGTLVRGGQ
jgi:hypothetical protein